MNKGITVKELYEACAFMVKNGDGDKLIQISGDDEGNYFHSLFYLFSNDPVDLQYYVDEGMMPHGINNVNEIVILG